MLKDVVKHVHDGNVIGYLVTLEGIDRAGKSTQSKLLLQWLKEIECDALLVKRPSPTPVGELLTRSHKEDIQLQSITKFLLYAADNSILASTVIRPALKAGKIVIIARYVHSAFTYFPPVGLPIQWLKNVYEFMPPPNLTFILDLPAQVGLERLMKDDGKLNYYTSGYNVNVRTRRESFLEFQENVRHNYLDLAKDNPDIIVIDATKSINEVQNQIKNVLLNRLRLKCCWVRLGSSLSHTMNSAVADESLQNRVAHSIGG